MSQRNKARVTGIYATGLCNLLLDYGYRIVEPSILLQERLDLEDISAEPDVRIRDKRDKHGVVITGERSLIEDLRIWLSEDLEESIFFYKSGEILEIDFPLPMKRKLDHLREEVVTTLGDHHYYKAFGGEVGAALDMAERLIMKGDSKKEVMAKFQSLVSQYLPYEGLSVGVDHVKLEGLTIDLGKAHIRELTDDLIVYEREMKSDGVYDGLNVEKEAGDKAVSEVNFSQYFIETSYYSKDGKLRGTYFNVNTPVEVYSQSIRYIDLGVDVMVWPDGRREIVDKIDLENAESRGVITHRLAEKAMQTARKLSE
jgi:protein associated with RNAse G/E